MSLRTGLKHLYEIAPPQVREWAQIAYHALPPEVRYGRPYRDAVKLFKETEYWPEDRLIAYQEERLRTLVAHAYANVPYYREIFDERGLKPKDIESVGDLSKLPILTKETIRLRRQDLIAKDIPRIALEAAHTSGSTGSPLTFYMDRSTRPVDRALALRRLQWLGHRTGDTTAIFKGMPLTNSNKFIQYFHGAREVRMSFHHATEMRLEAMVNALDHYRPDFIDAWPSCLHILCRWARRAGRRLPSPRFIVTASENLYPHMREYLQDAFEAPVIDWYGQEESVAVAMECSYAKGYHVQMEMGIVELLPAKEEGLHEIVGTCLHNRAMPFIRYRTGDLAEKGPAGVCPCGRSHPRLARFRGRETELVVTPEGRMVSPLILHFAFYHLEEIREAQLVQEAVDRLHVRVIPWKAISSGTEARLTAELRDRLESPAMNIRFEVTDEIPRGSGGKRPFFLSRLETQDYL